MDTILAVFIGFAAGYLLGAKDGAASYTELRESWKVVSSSEDFKAIRSGAPVIALAVLKQWLGGMAGLSGRE